MTRPSLLAGELLPPAPRQARSREKRDRILTAAVDLFAERGYEAASIADIAARAGVPVGGFYRYFASKRQLMLVLMDSLVHELAGLDLRPDPALGPRAGIRGLLVTAIARDLAYLGVYRAWQEASLTDPVLVGYEREVRRWTTGRVAGALAHLAAIPGARSDLELSGLAVLLDDLLWGILARAAVNGITPEVERLLDAATYLIFHAIFGDQARE